MWLRYAATAPLPVHRGAITVVIVGVVAGPGKVTPIDCRWCQLMRMLMPSTRVSRPPKGSRAGLRSGAPSVMRKRLPWQGQAIRPSRMSVTLQPWWVQIAEKSWNSPGFGWVWAGVPDLCTAGTQIPVDCGEHEVGCDGTEDDQLGPAERMIASLVRLPSAETRSGPLYIVSTSASRSEAPVNSRELPARPADSVSCRCHDGTASRTVPVGLAGGR